MHGCVFQAQVLWLTGTLYRSGQVRGVWTTPCLHVANVPKPENGGWILQRSLLHLFQADVPGLGHGHDNGQGLDRAWPLPSRFRVLLSIILCSVDSVCCAGFPNVKTQRVCSAFDESSVFGRCLYLKLHLNPNHDAQSRPQKRRHGGGCRSLRQMIGSAGTQDTPELLEAPCTEPPTCEAQQKPGYRSSGCMEEDFLAFELFCVLLCGACDRSRGVRPKRQ